ncbi:NAD(P)/FAD-dependent oxidoreductase [Roseomonas sp. SSH11]|uniref:NAD(P)/FAD-dependent oxidoreductase n=1 Tax=Pararoseomonas baculiformis TaxID=2820812 RepID=A0ABS4ABY1_9PROT|nr:NAD(P)/FAD-dependent oxidoreductase [Pararoseomonas baculiformis]MBP0444515.1 NAD(P)/FAD-dependent oxidoreductase [Pararoseomonas baculiformis]
MNNHFDAIILGAGAAGMMCAFTAGRRGRRVLLLDHAEAPGAKILISGGGRCNFTNTGTEPSRFFSANPHFARSALSRYTQHDFIALVEKHRIPYHEKTLGQLFCDGSARAIVGLLLDECEAAGVDLRLRHRVVDVSRAEAFRVETDRGTFTAPALVLATGGLSIPKMGATGLSLEVARRFGLPIVETRPALVPLTFGEADLALMRPISGVSLPVEARAGKTRFREAMLFTHRGLSGPAILQVSTPWRAGEAVTLDLLPDVDATAWLLARKNERPKAALHTVLAEQLPQRLASALGQVRLAQHTRPIGELGNKALKEVATLLKGMALTPTGTEGYAKAEVMAGGVDTAALSSQTMAAQDVPGLHVIGEAVDVTGWLGGYNFQWAWSSGWCAGMSV